MQLPRYFFIIFTKHCQKKNRNLILYTFFFVHNYPSKVMTVNYLEKKKIEKTTKNMFFKAGKL